MCEGGAGGERPGECCWSGVGGGDWRRAGLEEEQSGPGHARDGLNTACWPSHKPMSEADFSRVLGARGGGPGRGGTGWPMASRWVGAAGAVGLSG